MTDRSQLSISNYQLRDRFQGAMLGVVLVPSAICCLFKSSPRDVTQVEKEIPTWLTLIAKLLRTHDHRAENRHRKIVAEGTWLSVNSSDIAQQLMLSDVLAWILTYKGGHWDPQTAGERLTLRSLADEISQSDMAETASLPEATNLSVATQRSSVYRHYYGLWTVIFSSLHAKSLLQHIVALTPAEQSAHQFIIKGILSTVSQLNDGGHRSYGELIAITTNDAFVQNAQISGRTSFSDSVLADTFSEALSWQAPLVCGLLSGAALGRSKLPVLWQNTIWKNTMRLTEEPLLEEDVLALANRCFDQWLGCLA